MAPDAIGMMPRRRADLVVGGGPAGATAALYAARADLDVQVVDRGVTAGALGKTGTVANFPGLPPMPGVEIVMTLRRQAVLFGGPLDGRRVSRRAQAVLQGPADGV